ncbi:hydrocephalus-inducing protein-like [Pholidichthys leucotaenia]
MQIQEGDKWKTVFQTPSGHFECLVPFRWTEEAATAFAVLRKKFSDSPILGQVDPMLQCLVEVDASDLGVTPSVFEQEMLQTTEDRLSNTMEVHPPRILEWLDMTKASCHKLSYTDQPLFQPYPSELIFQKFSPGESYSLPLVLRNTDKISRHVKLDHQDSPYFHVESPESAPVAPGLTTSYEVLFTPQENKDYHHQLVFATDRERFEVPIHAIGPRAILDFRDEIHLPVCPVKASTAKTQLVRNIGNSKANFKLYTKRPFVVTPSCGTLDVLESMQVTVHFHPTEVGDHMQDLLLCYHTGEDVYIGLYGSCEELNVHLKPDCLYLTKTYISLESVHTVSLTNSSDTTLQYFWTMWPSQQEEDQHSLRQMSVHHQEEGGKEHSHSGSSDPTARSQSTKDHLFALPHCCLTVEPKEGEIPPNFTRYFRIVFKPEEAKSYEQTIYCNVTGHKARLPLVIKGEGLGPKLELKYSLIDMKNIVIGDKANFYEVTLLNTGLIDAPWSMSSPDTTFGHCFSFSPEKGVLCPAAHQTVKVTFCSSILGTFSEDLSVTVTGEPQPLSMTFRGCVIAPPFSFNVSELNFGDVAFGFPQTLKFTLFNTSFVPMTFALRVLGDGQGSFSVNSAKQVSDMSLTNWQGHAVGDWNARPAEFTIEPAEVSVRCMSDVTIKVTLCSNTVKEYRVALDVDVKDVGKALRTLPITARCIVPKILVETPVVDFRRCFLNHPSEQKMRLNNPNSLPACYGIQELGNAERLDLEVHSPMPRGVILPGSFEDVPVILLAKAVGRLHHTLSIAVFGSLEPPLEVALSCIGQGPVVVVQSKQLLFGNIPVLTDISKTLHLTNQSPIPAHFTTNLSSRRSFWHTEPREGEIPPDSQLELQVVAHLKDTLHFEDRLMISIQDGQRHDVLLTATGTGTSVVSDKPFGPRLDLGTYLSHGSCEYRFTLTNCGQRVHLMHWKNDTFGIPSKTHKGSNTSKRPNLSPIFKQWDTWNCGLPHSSSVQNPVFSLSPSRVELFPGCSVDMVLTGYSDSPKDVCERLVCNALIGNERIRETIMSVDVSCRFVTPMLNISSKRLNFYIKKVKDKSVTPLYEKLVLKNVSSLSLSIKLSLVEPFSLCEASGDYSSVTVKNIVLGDKSQTEMWVCFNPTFYQDRVSRTENEFLEIDYLEHPHHDRVELHAEVHYPNLHFSSTLVDFGYVFHGTETWKSVTITNCSPLPVSYSWSFVTDTTYSNIRCKRNLQPVAVGHRGTRDTGEVEVTLKNTGKAGFHFSITQPQREEEEADKEERQLLEALVVNEMPPDTQTQKYMKKTEVRPGLPVVIPAEGFINAGTEQRLRVLYLPGIPDVFEVKLKLQVAFLPPQDITLTGVGVFPRIRLNLPQNLSDECYTDVVQQARAALETDRVRKEHLDLGETTEANCTSMYEELFHMEVERLLVKENAHPEPVNPREQRGSSTLKFQLPEYVLDFGYVIASSVVSHIVNVTNTGSVPVSFGANCKCLAGTGFTAEFERVKNLPCKETRTFRVKFDPQSANLMSGAKSIIMPIQVAYGPMVQVRLCAVVAMPSITVSSDVLEFDMVQCGMCQLKALQLLNPEPVDCQWSIAEEVRPGGARIMADAERDNCLSLAAVNIKHRDDRSELSDGGGAGGFRGFHSGASMEMSPCSRAGGIPSALTVYERKKGAQKPQPSPVVFEMIPCSGALSPGERINVHVKFSPLEGCPYKRRLVVHVAESTKQAFITAQGQGILPHLEFCPSELELGPCLPASTEVQAEVIVKNPCSVPIEFYSLDFDKQYLKEEKILRLMQGYDDKNKLLLPPRQPGESLPAELLDYYKTVCSKHDIDSDMDEEEAAKEDTKEKKPKEGVAHPEDLSSSVKPVEMFVSELTRQGSSGRFEQLEMTPVFRAIGCHMGFDLSPEGLAACNCRGIAIIVYGAPLIEKHSAAATLAHHYGAACLSVDAVVTDVLLSGTSPVSLTARQLYDCAAAEYAQRKTEESLYITGLGMAFCPTLGMTVSLSTGNHPQSIGQAEHTNQSFEATLRCVAAEYPSSWSSHLTWVEYSMNSAISTATGLTPFEASLGYTPLLLPMTEKEVVVPSGGDMKILGTLLSEQLLADILAERFQLSDCYRGIVIDNLESAYTRSAASTLQVVLKSLRNRRHIYIINLSDSYEALNARKTAQIQAEEALQKEIAAKEEQWLEELDDYEYDALQEEDRWYVIEQYREKLRQQKLRELEQMAKKQEEKRQQEEMKRLREEDLRKKSKKGGKGSKEALRKKNFLEGKQSAVDELQLQFIAYEQCQAQIEHILHHWDRAQGLLLVPLPSKKASPVSDEPLPKKQSPAAGKRNKKANSKIMSPLPSHTAAPAEGDKAEAKLSPLGIIPHIVLKVMENKELSVTELVKGSTLPPLDKVLDDLGIGPSGPPIPAPVTFSIIPFPKLRKQTVIQQTCFTFLVPLGQDEQEEEKKDSEEDLLTSDEGAVPTPSKGLGNGSIKDSAMTKNKATKGRESQRSKVRTSTKTKAKGSDRLLSFSLASSMSESDEQHQANLEQKRSQSLTTFRWVVPANGKVVLKIWFYSDSHGKFEQTFSFELVGTRRLYKLICRGVCTYPSICKDYMTLFTHCKKVTQLRDGLQKAYVIKPGFFEFGLLLCSKTRDRYKENRYPENALKLVIYNNSDLEAVIQFHFQHDGQATTYLLDPPTMTLKADQKQMLTVWAYPTTPGQIKDSIVCMIKDSPEPVIINLSCWGVRPELELESNHLHFDRILVNREDRRSVKMHNKTGLPVSWRLHSLEELGDEFHVTQDQGIIPPNSSFPLSLEFRSKRPCMKKKTIRLEVSDMEKIVGVMQTENIQVTAEAYDIAVDIIPDTLDFGTLKVFEESTLTLKMKNLGRYPVNFDFLFAQKQLQSSSIFQISSSTGTLSPNDKFTPEFEMGFSAINAILTGKWNRMMLETLNNLLFIAVNGPEVDFFPAEKYAELWIREGRHAADDGAATKKRSKKLRSHLKPDWSSKAGVKEEGETIHIIRIKVSVQAVFTSYEITPVCDINFGPLSYGSKKSQGFIIQNSGIFETTFNIYRMVTESAIPSRPGVSGSDMGGPGNILSGRPTETGSEVRQEASQKDMNLRKNRLVTGIFSVSPCTAVLQPGSRQLVTVECVALQLGNCDQTLLIDISDRNPSDHPEGIPYRLLAEVCEPGIMLDAASIFEEHLLCHNSSQLCSEQFCNAESIYVMDEKRFIFNTTLVGRSIQARFKFTNTSKVPCVLSLAIRNRRTKTSRNVEVFHLSPSTLTIPNQSHAFTVVTFTPQTKQLYSAVFEATVEGLTRLTPAVKSKVLDFDLVGEGTLPSACVLHPALRNNEGSPLLRFRRVLVGRRDRLPLVLLNDGDVPAQVRIDMLDKHRVFTIKAVPSSVCSTIHSTELEPEHQMVHRAILSLNVNETVEFEVSFCSDKSLQVKAKISVQVKDNPYSNATVEVTAEAYQKIVTIDNIRIPSQGTDHERDQEDNYEVLNFGDCHVNCSYQESFTMTNHSSSQVVRFEWPSLDPHVTFLPQVGHLHAGCTKEVTVTFSSSEPVTLSNQPMGCKLCQVEFQQPIEQVADWDDRQKTVQWLDSSQDASVKDKVINADPEPCCSVVEGSQFEMDLCISAVCNYAMFSCDTATVHFKDTMLYQTRLQQLQIINKGSVKVEYTWQVLMDRSSNIVSCDKGVTDGSFTSQPGSRSAGSQARPSSTLASVTSLLTQNPELHPFIVEPSVGVIKPGATQNFSVGFSPLEVEQFQGKLFCSIPNLQDGDSAPCVFVCGRSLLPHCHFDLEDSDYLSCHRRNPELRSTLDTNTKVLEFNAVGLSTPSKRYFSVMNPTSGPYTFKWRCEDAGGSQFRCLTPSGTILPGKKVKVCFEYVAEQLDAVESFWSFVIETTSVSVPLLCVGTAREPLIYLNTPHLDFSELVVGHQVEKTVELVNGEMEPLNFSVIQSSLICVDQQLSLILRPMTGTVAPKDRLPLSVFFTPSHEGYASFKVALRVKRKSDPLILTVKTTSFSMNASVQVERPNGGLKEVLPNHQDSLDFGKIGISEQSVMKFLVANDAGLPLEVHFEITGPSELLQQLEAKPQSATIEIGIQMEWLLLFIPQNICNLQDVKLNIKVKHGPTFSFMIKGQAVAPSLEFSFTKFNFGKCFLHSPGMVPATQTLVISNKGKRNICLQSQFKNTPFLKIDFQPDILTPAAMIEVPIAFYPHEACHYNEKITFVLNSCVTKQVDILGQGVNMKLEVKEPRQKKIKLGSLTVGQKVKRNVVLVNRSTLDLLFTLVLSTNSPLEPKDLSFSPFGQLKLRSNGDSCNVDIQFSPHQPIPPFTAELQAEIAGFVLPLVTIEGCCQVAEVQLDQNHLSFGAVVQCCQAKKRIFLMNKGDIDARFRWKTDSFPAELSITPTEGFIHPRMNCPLDVTFAPVKLSDDIRFENLSCFVEGSSSLITLTVTGSCITTTTGKEVLNFICPVRRTHTQDLALQNPTNQRCRIKPVIEGEQWRVPLFVTLEAHQNKTFKITYQPLTMTTGGEKHQGSVFFSFPDGTGIRCPLQGTADPPLPEDTVVHELPAKIQHSELLPVQNWLSRQQRFSVLREIINTDKPDAVVSLEGLKYIEVPGLAKREYRLSVFIYRKGQYNTKVTFRNEETGEYLFYLITFKTTSPGILSTIELVTAVRQVASATVQVENPLSTAVCLTTECKCPDICVPPQHTIPGKSKGVLTFEYQPLQAGKSTARLTLFSSELGHFYYDLLLKALPPPPEKTVNFSTPLGSSNSVLIKFLNYSRFKTEYSCKTDCPDFTVDKSVSASPGFQEGSKVNVEVCFEPHQLGEVKGQLCVFSAIGGEYVFPLHGLCHVPKPQGPFSIKDGRSVDIPFKNVFLQTTAFSFQIVVIVLPLVSGFIALINQLQGGIRDPWLNPLAVITKAICGSQCESGGNLLPDILKALWVVKGNKMVDNSCFTVEGRDKLHSKKTEIIKVSFKAPTTSSPGPWYGKLIISSRRCEGHTKPSSWVYYLHGHRQQSF